METYMMPTILARISNVNGSICTQYKEQRPIKKNSKTCKLNLCTNFFYGLVKESHIDVINNLYDYNEQRDMRLGGQWLGNGRISLASSYVNYSGNVNTVSKFSGGSMHNSVEAVWS